MKQYRVRLSRDDINVDSVVYIRAFSVRQFSGDQLWVGGAVISFSYGYIVSIEEMNNVNSTGISVERVCIDNTWLGIGGNTPWNIEGMITNIEVTTFTMTDKVNVEITFDSGYILESIVTECKYLYK